MLYSLDDYDRAPLAWLWSELIPRGKVTLLSGDPGVGKSLFALHLAAALSRGQNPSTFSPTTPTNSRAVCPDSTSCCDTILLSAEDDPSDTIIPRLQAMNADLSRIHIAQREMRHLHEPGPTDHLMDRNGAKRIYDAFGRLQKGTDTDADRRLVGKEATPIRRYDRREALDLTDLTDKNQILQHLRGLPRPSLLIVDTIAGHLGDHSVTSNKAVRKAMDFLAEVAARHDMAVVVLCHAGKTQNLKYIHKALGSLYLTSAARSVLTITEDPSPGQTPAPAPATSSFPISNVQFPISAASSSTRPLDPSTPQPLLPSRLLIPVKSNCTIPHHPIPFAIHAGRLCFAPPRPPVPPRPSKLERARQFLREFLTQPTKSTLVKAHARELDIGNTTLHDAARELGITIARRPRTKPRPTDLTYYFSPPPTAVTNPAEPAPGASLSDTPGVVPPGDLPPEPPAQATPAPHTDQASAPNATDLPRVLDPLACPTEPPAAVQAHARVSTAEAQELLARMAATYAACASYRDSGTVTTISSGPDTTTDVRPFSTHFTRPDGFRFEFRIRRDKSEWDWYAIWLDKGRVRRWWTALPSAEDAESLKSALAGASENSRSLSLRVPLLLMPELQTLQDQAPRDATIVEDPEAAESDCVVIERRLATGHVERLWLHRFTNLLLRVVRLRPATGPTSPESIAQAQDGHPDLAGNMEKHVNEERSGLEPFELESITTYHPALNMVIAPPELIFPPRAG